MTYSHLLGGLRNIFYYLSTHQYAILFEIALSQCILHHALLKANGSVGRPVLVGLLVQSFAPHHLAENGV